MSLIRRAPKRLSAVIAIAVAAIVVPAAVFAWGPSRQTFTTAKPADFITFNSITDNPAIGDERNFMQIREADASNTTYADSINLTAGKEYVVFMYYHNNAASNLNLVAENAYAKAEIPALVSKNTTGTKAMGYVGASNAKPTQVWDDISFNNTTSGDIALRYIAGSATIHNFGKTDGATMSDSIVTSGAALGYNALDGKVPGCNEYAGYVTFRIKADQSNFNVSKQVRLVGSTTWGETVAAKDGDEVEYRISYDNVGTTEQTDVVVKDALPAGLTYTTGSTTLKNASNPDGKTVSDNLVTNSGINIGSYTAGSNAYVKFKTKVSTKDLPCGNNTLKNVATVYTKNGSKYDDATVTVTKECQPVVKYECKALGITVVDRTHFKFNTSYSVENASFKSVTYVVKNASGTTVDTKKSTAANGALDYTQTTVGTYTVQATLTVTVNGQDKTATSDGCKGTFTVPKQPGDISVCELATKKIITIKESDFDSSKHSTDLSKCQETPPVTPPELPHTGIGETLTAVIGLGALIASTGYYIASRRALGQ